MSVVNTEDAIARVTALLGSSKVRRPKHDDPLGHDATFLDAGSFVVVHPENTNDVVEVTAACRDLKMPLVTRGAGTSLVGGPVPIAGGIILSTERLTGLEIDAANACAVASAGVITGDLQAAAGRHGLMYPPDPGSVDISTIGGNIACNAGGMCSIKYGVTADYVIGLTVVLADGTVLRLGGKTRKRASGYRLMQLFVGSEGTLGVITEAVVKLVPQPRFRSAAMIGYDHLEEAAEAVARILAAGHFPCALEILDSNAIELLADHLPARFRPTLEGILIVEQDGNDESTTRAELSRTVMELRGAVQLVAQTDAERAELWAGRRYFGRILMSRRKNAFAEDIAVPLSSVPEMVRRVQTIAKEAGLTIATVGHAGDGNLHPSMLFDDNQRHLVGPAAARIMTEALDLGGTVSAEHGLGALKRDFAQLEHGSDAMRLMRDLKNLLDPEGLLNPHKIFPEAAADGEFLEHLPGWVPDLKDEG
ncbi:MAG TPA: FAD-linked oxidase C-terminal domain-containing protein [Chloroflexota bacterium]|nr:FAD-linked oxidase C-terminal domain-containing protein [Chloroflexota bacterium]